MKGMSQSQKDRAEKKIDIAIDKLIDLKEDFALSQSARVEIDKAIEQVYHLYYSSGIR